MFTHINTIEATSFTTGEIITGATSGATAVVASASTFQQGTTSVIEFALENYLIFA